MLKALKPITSIPLGILNSSVAIFVLSSEVEGDALSVEFAARFAGPLCVNLLPFMVKTPLIPSYILLVILPSEIH